MAANSVPRAPGDTPLAARRFTTKSPGWERPSVTVFYNATPGWSKDVGDRLTEQMRKSDTVFMRHWSDYFENGIGFLAALSDILPSLDATVIVLGPDDPHTIDGTGGPAAEPRRNVIVELGASIATIGAAGHPGWQSCAAVVPGRHQAQALRREPL